MLMVGLPLVLGSAAGASEFDFPGSLVVPVCPYFLIGFP